jgi:electron transfer flavoprotein beta subunit
MMYSKFLSGLLGSSLVLSAGFVGEVQAQLPAASKPKADETPKPVPDKGPSDEKKKPLPALPEKLAAEIKEGGYDLVLFGRIAIDSMNQMTGPMVAELLDLPCVTNVFKLDITGTTGRAERALEGATEVVEFPLPAVLTIDDGLNKERLPSLKGIMAAKKKPLDVKPAQLGEAKVTVHKMALPPERAAGRILGDNSAAVPELVRLLQTEAKVL